MSDSNMPENILSFHHIHTVVCNTKEQFTAAKYEGTSVHYNPVTGFF